MRQNAYSRNLKWTFEDLLLCYCYAIQIKSTTIRLQVSHPTSAGKGVNCALALSMSGASRSPLCPDGRRVHLSDPAYMSSCIRPEVRFPLDQRILCSNCCKKRKLLCLSQVFSYFVLHSNKIPLVLTTKVTHLRSLLFRHPDGVNCVVRRLFWVCPKTE